MPTRLAVCSLVSTALVWLAPSAGAQQHADVSQLPMVVGPGTQGFTVYRGPATPDFFWYCDYDGTNYTTIGEVAEEVHMLQAGDLASITFAYYVAGNGAITSGLATAILRIYANDATDSITPPGGLLASYTVPGLPWDTADAFTATYDIPAPFPVPQDLWIGIELVTPPGTAGSVLGAGRFGQSPATNVGSSHNLTWFGPSTCSVAPGELWNNSDFGFVGNYTILVRVFPPAHCAGAIPNGDFESGNLSAWSGVGRRGVLTAADSLTVPPSGAYQGYVENGATYPGTVSPVSGSALASALGVPLSTLSGLTSGGSVTQGSALTQTLGVQAGDVLTFKWNFQTKEPTPAPLRNDFAFLTIAAGGAVLLADTFYPTFVPSPGPYNEETGYQTYSYAFAAAGTVTIGFGVADRATTAVDSALLIDCVELVPGTSANQPPGCSADLAVARQDFLEVAPGAFVVTEGETLVVPFEGTDPDGDLLLVGADGFPLGAGVAPASGNAPLVSLLTWTPGAADKAGAPWTLAVTFTDPAGASSSCEVTVADVNLRPECRASDQTLECTSYAGAPVTLDGSATDADDPASALVYHWFVSDAQIELDDPSSPTPTGLFPVGITMATLTVADGRGGVDVCDVLITVQDTTPPEVLCTTDRAALWPPKHAMVPVTLLIAATDSCADAGEILPITVVVSSNEADDAAGNGDGSTTGDVGGRDGFTASVDATDDFVYDAATGLWTGTILLRAERAGAGSGRKYTIDVLAVDSSGNPSLASCCVVVPHDQRGTL